MKKSVLIAFALALSVTSVPAVAGGTTPEPNVTNFSLWSFAAWFSGKMGQISALRGF